MNAADKILELTEEALNDFNSPDYRLSNIIRKAIRIARLRNDYYNLWWLGLEMHSGGDESSKKRIVHEILPHYTSENFKYAQEKILKAYADERSVSSLADDETDSKEQVCVESVSEMEVKIEYFKSRAEKTIPPSGLHPVDLYFMEERYSKTRSLFERAAEQRTAVLKRIEQRVHEYLSLAEKQLIYGQINSDIFEQNRQYVDTRLRAIAPEVVGQFTAVYRRIDEGDVEARSQALLSCRRILKSLADKLYPAHEETVIGSDGKERKLTDDLYKARLWQFIADRTKGNTASGLLLAQLNDLGSRIDRVYELSNKGAHAEVSEFEVNQGVIQTYLLVGDILRLADQESALYTETGDAK